MSSPHTNGYDADLLNSVKVDKRAIQEGYSTDLLNDKPARPSPAPTPPPQRVGTTDSLRSREPSVLEAQAPLKPRKLPFYRTKKGLIIIGAVLVAIIVAAVVGGVVGSQNSKKNDGTTPVLGEPPEEQEIGQGDAPSDQQAGEQTSSSPGAPSNIASILGSAASGLTTQTAATPAATGQPPLEQSVPPQTGTGAPDPPLRRPDIELNSQAQALGIALD